MVRTRPGEGEEEILVRNLTDGDLDGMVSLDEKITGRNRENYLSLKLGKALYETGIQISLAAVIDGALVGFALAQVYYGEFGAIEQTAVLDTLEVHPEFQGRGVGAALMEQLSKNLQGLSISRLRTEVDWDDQRLLSFFHHEGFKPAPVLCLEIDLALNE